MIQNGFGHGTGFFVTSNLIVTNAHVVQNEQRVKIIMEDLTVLEGDVRVVNTLHDLALIEVPLSPLLSSLELDRDGISRGDEIYTIGFGDGEWYSPRYGTIRYPFYVKYFNMDTVAILAYLDVIGGHSGSPVFDTEGEVIGVISMGNGLEALIIDVKHVRQLVTDYYTYIRSGLKQ